jgi:hypothetical protein
VAGIGSLSPDVQSAFQLLPARGWACPNPGVPQDENCVGSSHAWRREDPVRHSGVAGTRSSNESYQVQSGASLSVGDGTNLGSSIPGEGAASSLEAPVAPGEPARFYRLIMTSVNGTTSNAVRVRAVLRPSSAREPGPHRSQAAGGGLNQSGGSISQEQTAGAQVQIPLGEWDLDAVSLQSLVDGIVKGALE